MEYKYGIPYIICFYWQGDRWQEEGSEIETTNGRSRIFMNKMGAVSPDLPAKYVNNLYYGAKRFADRPFKFVCFTDCDLDLDPEIEKRDFNPPTRMGVLPRLYMFSREAGMFGHQVLCLDLDVVIVGSLKPLLDYQGVFCGRGRFKPGFQSELDGDIMSFKSSEATERLFYKPFVDNVERGHKITGGRERMWMRHVAGDFADYWHEQAPGAVVSYKWHVQNKKIPEGASIISCHGVPRPHQIKEKWIKEYWK